MLCNPYIILNPSQSPIKSSAREIFRTIIPNIFRTMAESNREDISHTAPPSSTLPVRDVKPESEKPLTVGLGVASNYKAIEKAGNKSKKYMGARRSCAWIHFRPNGGSSAKYSPTRPSSVGVLKRLMVEWKEAH